MIQHVYERAAAVANVDSVIVATDDSRVLDAVMSFSGCAVMTSSEHDSGTDRLVEVMSKVSADVYINVQGDEPLIRPEDLDALVNLMQDQTIDVATLCHSIDSSESKNPNTVKVVKTHGGEALYFSRSPIPYPREESFDKYLKHVGVYAYRKSVLEKYSRLPESYLESAELLEQLRLLSAGIRIHVLEVEPTGPGVDTPECLEKVRAIFQGETYTADLKSPLKNTRPVITDDYSAAEGFTIVTSGAAQ